MSDLPDLIGRWRYPFSAAEIAALARFTEGWCKRNGYYEPYIVTEGPQYFEEYMTIVAVPKESKGV